MHNIELELIILEFLKENPYTSIEDVRKNALTQIKARELEITLETCLQINSIIWDNIAERVLTPGKDMNNLDLPYIHVSNKDKLKHKLNEDKDL